jgi:hypothetical protein
VKRNQYTIDARADGIHGTFAFSKIIYANTSEEAVDNFNEDWPEADIISIDEEPNEPEYEHF